ncbi:hypothetical protein [Parabacteroides distasonis]|uniref:hypothetical protein n=1 Tax=Parabacteroides distasonis TaxID=823 RepID=UPI001CCDF537|nr:hypothetical protein [Parabacteroides distasonis]UBD79577.1 hypothetical protein K6V20_21390 [Parabacteroides distasonis]
METVGAIQETYDIWSWLLSLISGAIGALIGTYGGSYFLHWKQEKKIKNVRSMAVKALDIFKEYAQHKKSYADSANEFNTKLNVSEKRAVVVALHKIGVPFEISTKDDFDIKNLRLKDIIIDRDEIDAMIQQIEKGNCDNLFFIDIESYFTSNLRLNAVRNVGKKYVEEVQSKSRVEKDAPNTIVSQPDWHKVFSPGELQIIFVLRIQLANTAYFLPDGNADPVKMKTLIREIEIGLWDNYLFWEYESYQNIRAQHNLANIIQNAVMGQQMMNIGTQMNNEKGSSDNSSTNN